MKLNEIYMRDPFIYVEGDTCFLIGTTDKQAWKGKASGFLGYKTKDLINFEGPFILFENSPSFWADENFWAPELYKIDGKYYIFASFFVKGQKRALQALISDTPFGKYQPSKKPFTPKEWNCLDATYYEEEGHRYTVFCHEWLDTHDGQMCVGELNDDFTELTNIQTIFKASDAKWVKGFMDKGTINYVTDGPFIYKTKNGRLILIWSSNSKNGYCVGISYSDNGIMGPWKQRDELLLNSDSGHGMIFEFKNNKYLIVHNSNRESGSERPVIYKIKEENNMIYLDDK